MKKLYQLFLVNSLFMLTPIMAIAETYPWMAPQPDQGFPATVAVPWTPPEVKPSFVPVSVGKIVIFIPLFKKDNAILAGLDSDGDGIRDDVQAEIDSRYANDEFSRKYSLLSVLMLQQVLTDTEDRSTWETIGYVDQLTYCLQQFSQDPKAGEEFLFPLLFNTPARARKYLSEAYNAISINGSLVAPTNVCTF